MNEIAQRSATWLIVAGVVTVLFGVVAMIWPIGTAIALVILWGCYALVDGILAFAAAFAGGQSAGGRVFLIMVGLIGIAAGLFAIVRPGVGAVTLTWVLGIWLMVRGVMEVVAAFSTPGGSRVWLVIGGALWFLAGLFFAVNPGAAAVSLALWLGIFAVAWGVALIVGGVTLRREQPAPAH